MGHLDPLFEIDIRRPRNGARGGADDVRAQLEAAIREGRLAPGTRLPPTRQAAALFGVSRNTAAAIYERLSRDQWVVTRRGSGTYVAGPRPPRRSAIPVGAAPAPANLINPFWLRPEVKQAIGFWHRLPEHASRVPDRAGIDFRPALVDSSLFPFDALRASTARALRKLGRKPAAFRSGQGNQVNFDLRSAICTHLSVMRAVACDAEDVVITSGAQQAFDLLARVLVKPGETVVAVEDPGYPPLRVAFAAAGARVVPVRVDDEGLDVASLPEDARIICVCPSHQFPFGVTLSPRRRKALLDFARRRGAVIVEDDYDGEFRYERGPVAALRSRTTADAVLYVGTFSKCMLPALRLGFVVVPEWARPAVVTAKNCLDWHCPTPLQLAVADFISEGHLARHVRKMRRLYQKRRDALLHAIDAELRPWLSPLPSAYGMHVTAVAPADAPIERITRELLDHPVMVHSLRRYFAGRETQNGILFGLGAADVAQIERGVTLLARSLARG